MKRYKSATILGGGPPGKIVQCQSFLVFPKFFRIQISLKNSLLIIIYSVVNLNISILMDTRLLVIAGPLLIAASWALVNIGRLAIQQLQRMK